MSSEQMQSVAERSKDIYENKLRLELEKEHRSKYVTIEPKSGDYFLGETFDEAVNAAIDAHPNRLTHTIRIGHIAALHLGVLVR
jgi:hypothetical protein